MEIHLSFLHLKVRQNISVFFLFFVNLSFLAPLLQPPPPVSSEVQRSATESIQFFYVAYHSKIFQKQGHLFTVLSDTLIKKKLFQAARRGWLPKTELQDKEKVLASITDLEYTEVDRFIENKGAQPVIPVRAQRAINSSRIAAAERAARLEEMRSRSSSSNFSFH